MIRKLLKSSIIIGLLFISSSVFATSYIQIYPYISHTGIVYTIGGYPFTGCDSYGGATQVVYGYKVYSGTYPDTSVVTFSGSAGGDDCFVTFQNPTSPSSTMEGTWHNTIIPTPDGNYWVAVTFAGTAFTPDFSGDVYYWGAERSGGNWTATYDTVPNTDTHFSILNPTDEETIINPLISFSADWLVSGSDLDKLTTIFSGPANKIKISLQITEAVPSPTWSETLLDYTLPTGFETSTTSVSYRFDGTDPNLNYGKNYKLVWTMFGSNYDNIFGPVFSVSTTTYFSMGTTTESGHILENLASTTKATLEQTAFNNGYSPNACNPVSGDFNVADCILSMVTPDDGFYEKSVGQIREGVFGHVPFGYVGRFVSILTSTSTEALPAFDAPVRIGEATSTDAGTMHIAFDMNDIVLGAGTVLADTRDPYYGKNLKDVFEPIVNFLIALAVILIIIKDIMGSHRNEHDPSGHRK